MLRVVGPLTLLLLTAVALSGCASWERRWRSAGRGGDGEVTGRWEGTWRSSRHRSASGRLRAIVSQPAPGSYHADFRANWLIFATNYTTPLQARRTAEGTRAVSTAADLGPLFGGTYRTEGTLYRDRWEATYTSRTDEGSLRLRRVFTVGEP